MLSLSCIGKIKKGCCLSLFLIGLSPMLLFAEDKTVTNPVSLQEVLIDITKTDPAILESLKQYESVVAERSIATSEYYPTVGTELSTGPERTDGVPTDFEEKDLIANTATLYAKQNLFNGGKTSAYVKETDARIYAAAFEVLNVANRTYLDVAEAYVNVIKARDLLGIAEKNALTQERIMRQVREKTEAGFNRVSELYNSESRLVLSKGNYISRQQDLNQALVAFHRLFGRVLEPAQFIEPQPTVELPSSLPDAVEVAFERHPALKVAKYNIEKTRYSYKKSAASYYPSLDLELKGQYREDTGGEEGETNQSGAYLTLSYVLFDGGYRKGATARDQQSMRKEYQRSYIERRNVNETVRLAWNIMEAEQFKKEYLSEHVQLSKKTLGAFKEEYYVGRRTLLDLLNMENEYTDAEMSLTQSKYSYLTSLYQIMQATGVLLAEHDTGLRGMLTLPEEQDDPAEYEKKEYEVLDANRDKDIALDTVDQCDNTRGGLTVKASGCEKDDAGKVGYPHEDAVLITPYITTADYSAPASATVKKPSASAEESNMRLTLEVMANSQLLTEKARAELTEFATRVLSRPATTIVIEGYTASDNDTIENMKLSEQRANLVKELLIQQGIDESKISAVGKGIENPRAANDSRNGRAMNRRVEITVQ
jgi:adhesin transport system outer membrane protein